MTYSGEAYEYGLLKMEDAANAVATVYLATDDGVGDSRVIYRGPVEQVIARLGREGWRLTPVETGFGASWWMARPLPTYIRE